MKFPVQIREIFEKGSDFLLASHENPDSDALGSMLALSELLESLGKRVFLYNSSGVPSFLRFLSGSDRIQKTLKSVSPEDFDALVVLDCPVPSRVGYEFEEFASLSSGPLVIIDHHEQKQSPGAVKWVETDAPATGILVYEIFRDFSRGFSRQSAACIYAAISGDTGSFRFSNTTALCLRVASEMVACGAEPEAVSMAIYENQPRERISLLARVLETLGTDKTGRIAWVRISAEMFQSTGTSREDSEGMVDIPMSIKGVQVALLFRQESAGGKTFWKGSIRSRGDIDVCRAAAMFGGGGHKNAAGFTFEGDFDSALRKIVENFNGRL